MASVESAFPLPVPILNLVEAPASNWVTVTQDIFQILFFIAVGTVTVLGYQTARKTLLQPLRTEVFKEQLKLFTEISELFVGKGVSQLALFDFDFWTIIEANIQILLTEYAQAVFNIKRIVPVRRYDPNQFNAYFPLSEESKVSLTQAQAQYLSHLIPRPEQPWSE